MDLGGIVDQKALKQLIKKVETRLDVERKAVSLTRKQLKHLKALEAQENEKA